MIKYALGVDIGGSHACSAVVDLKNGVILEDSCVTLEVDSKANASSIIDRWSEAMLSSLHSCRVPVDGIGIAMPGPFDYRNGISLIKGVDKYNGIFGLDVTTSLLGRLSGTGINEIRYTNDAAAFALGEYLGGSGKGHRRMMALTVGTGFGSGFIADGRVVTDGEEVPANGWVFCLPFDGSIADEQFTTRWFVKRHKELTGKVVDGAKEIADRAGSDRVAEGIFQEYGERLARFSIPVFENFRADILVIGGNISRAFPLFYPSFERYADQKDAKLRVVPSVLNDKAAMMGAASLFL